MRWKNFAWALLLWPSLAFAQGVPIKDGITTDLMGVNTANSALVNLGASTRPTYIAFVSCPTGTCSLVIESTADKGFKLAGWCLQWTNNTAASALTATVQRRITVSSGGTVVTAEGTASPSVSKMDPADGNYSGVVRASSISGITLGTASAVIDGVSTMGGEIGAGTADHPGPKTFCRSFEPAKMPVVTGGIANGVSITTSVFAGGFNPTLSLMFIVD